MTGSDRAAVEPVRERLWLKRLVPLAGGAVALGALVLVFSSSGGVGDVAGALDRVTPGWMLAAVWVTILGYLINALQLRRLTGNTVSLWCAARTDLLLFGLGNVLPGSPAPGVVMAGAELRRNGLEARRVRLVLAFTVWFNIRTLLLIGAISFLVTVARQRSGLEDLGLWWLAAVGVLLLLAVSARLAARPQSSAGVARLLAHVRIGRLSLPPRMNAAAAATMHTEAKAIVGTPYNRAVLVALAAGGWVADAVCLRFALAAAGVNLDADVVLLAYIAGTLASGLPLLPAGAGVVEATIPAVLHGFGAPLGAALAGTLAYRGVSTLLPAAIGGLVLAGSARSARTHRKRAGVECQREPPSSEFEQPDSE